MWKWNNYEEKDYFTEKQWKQIIFSGLIRKAEEETNSEHKKIEILEHEQIT